MEGEGKVVVVHRKGCENDGADAVAESWRCSQCQGAALHSGMAADEERAREYDAKRRCTHSWNRWPTLPERQRGYFQRKNTQEHARPQSTLR